MFGNQQITKITVTIESVLRMFLEASALFKRDASILGPSAVSDDITDVVDRRLNKADPDRRTIVVEQAICGGTVDVTSGRMRRRSAIKMRL